MLEIDKKIISLLKQSDPIELTALATALGVSKQYISRRLQQLSALGEVEKIGKTKGAYFILTDINGLSLNGAVEYCYHKTYNRKNLTEDAVLNEIEYTTKILQNIPKNSKRKFAYIFTEMVNNAIDHSAGNSIQILVIRDANRKMSCWILDDGIGIYNHLIAKLKLTDNYSAIQELLKGKTTTDPARHTGEGIFFGTRLADRFIIDSGDKRLIFKQGEPAITTIPLIKGTRIKFVIDFNSSVIIEDIFKKFTDKFEFTRTEILVKLYEIKTEFISRSEAKRLLHGLDRFKYIMLDFNHVKMIGQGFADEVFRVWQNNHPQIQVDYCNAIKDVEFMIKRAQLKKNE